MLSSRFKIIWQHIPKLLSSTTPEAACLHSAATAAPVTASQSQSGREVDELYTNVEILLKGHDQAVLSSYEKFVSMVCKELELPLTCEDRNRPTFRRLTLNRSPFVHKRHMTQYELRTYWKTLRLAKLTGSTASVFLEYIQRNLPEGVAMRVTKEAAEPLTDYMHRLNEDKK